VLDGKEELPSPIKRIQPAQSGYVDDPVNHRLSSYAALLLYRFGNKEVITSI
jgi:hypothetical protein